MRTDRAQKAEEKNGVICLVIVFTPGVMIIKMSKDAHFLYFLLMAAKNKSQLRQNIYEHLKDFTVWLIGFGVTVYEILVVEISKKLLG